MHCMPYAHIAFHYSARIAASSVMEEAQGAKGHTCHHHDGSLVRYHILHWFDRLSWEQNVFHISRVFEGVL